MPVQGLIDFFSRDETLDRWTVLITGAYCNPCTWIQCQAVRSTHFVLWTEYGVPPYSVERMFRSEARLVTIQSINSVRPSIWLTTEYEQHPGISYQYRVQIWYSVHNTTAHPPRPSQHALRVIQMVISIPTGPPGVAMCSVRSILYTKLAADGIG